MILLASLITLSRQVKLRMLIVLCWPPNLLCTRFVLAKALAPVCRMHRRTGGFRFILLMLLQEPSLAFPYAMP